MCLSKVTKEEPAWVTELEEHAQVHFRLAALADMTAFPPQVTTQPTVYTIRICDIARREETRDGGRVDCCLSESGSGKVQDAGSRVQATQGWKQGG